MKGKRSFIWILVFSIIIMQVGYPGTLEASGQSTGWEYAGSRGFSEDDAWYTAMALDSSGRPYVVYQDVGNDYKATVMMLYSGSTWLVQGAAGFSEGRIQNPAIAVDGVDVPYVAFRDGGNGYKATVMKCDSIDWSYVGSPGFSDGSADWLSIAFDSSGIPYAAYQDWGSANGKATVMKYVSDSWIPVGDPGISDSYAYYTDIAFDSDDNLYLAYKDAYEDDKGITVKKYTFRDGWQTVGESCFSDDQVNFTSIEIDSSDVPYVAFADKYDDANEATVMKFNGTSWVNVGEARFTQDQIEDAEYGSVEDLTLAFDSNDLPCVAFSHTSNNGKASVFKFDGSQWKPLGIAGFTDDYAYSTSIGIDGDDTVYVAFRDGANADKASVMKYIQDTSVVDAETPAITMQPSDVVVDRGEKAIFSIRASVSQGTLSYQWYENTADTNEGGTIIPGQVFDTFMPSTANEGTYYYYCTVTNTDPSATGEKVKTVKSEVASLDVQVFHMEIMYLPEGTVGEAYHFDLVGKGGTEPYYWTVEGLPAGMNTTGAAITGVPETSGTYLVTITLVDSEERHTDNDYDLVIESESSSPKSTSSRPKLVIDTSELPDGIEGEDYEAELTGDGGRAPYEWTAEGLPDGLEIDEDGYLAGVPLVYGDFEVKLELFDKDNYYRSRLVDLHIEEAEDEEGDMEETYLFFEDTEFHWAMKNISDCMKRGILNGYPDGYFRPEKDVTKAEFVKMVFKAMNFDEVGEVDFPDVLGHWASKEIATLVNMGIAEVCEDGMFCPDEAITREEMAVIAAKALGLKTDVPESEFKDYDKISEKARPYVDACVAEGIMEGYADGQFKPLDNLTRAEASKIISLMLQSHK